MALDVTQHAIIGVGIDRRHEIKSPTRRKCDGCGVAVYLTAGTIEPAARVSAQRKKRLYITCRKCAEPFMNHIAKTEGEIVGDREVIEREILPDMIERRKAFLRSN